MKNPNHTIGNRTRDLPTCNAVPQPTALPRSPMYNIYRTQFKKFFTSKYLLSVYIILYYIILYYIILYHIILYYITAVIVTAYKDIVTYCGMRILTLPRTVLSVINSTLPLYVFPGVSAETR